MIGLLGRISVLLFFATALAALWIAHDQPTAYLQFSLMSVGLLLALILKSSGQNLAGSAWWVLGTASALAVACLGFLFIVLPGIPSGPVANSLAILLPITLCEMFQTRSLPESFRRPLVPACVLIGVVALIWTRERTAWLALSVGVLAGSFACWRVPGTGRRSRNWLLDVAPLAVAILLLVGYVVITIDPTSQSYLGDLPMGPLIGRLALWHDSLALIQDNFFLGSGFSNTAMALSSYVFLLHVPFQGQAHNLFLEMAIEQGVPGLVAFLGLMAGAGWSLWQVLRSEDMQTRRCAAGTAASLVALLVYGMFDSEAYASLLVPVIFVPMGCAWFLAGSSQIARRPPFASLKLRGGIRCVVALIVLMGVGLTLSRSVRACLFGNLGAVSQMRAELSVYRWPKWQLQDYIRRSPAVDLSTAMAAYRRALSLDPTNATANRRLGQIELARGDYQSAQRHLEAAYAAAPYQRATRQMLGEVYAIGGDYVQAVNLWRSIDTSQGQLEIRRWLYHNLGADVELKALNEGVDLLEQRIEKTDRSDRM